MPKRSFLQKAFMDPPKHPDGNEPWDSLTQEEKDAVLAQAKKDWLYGESQPSYLVQGMKAAMEALGPKPKSKSTPQAKVPEAQTWNQFMDRQDAKRATQAQTRTFMPVASFPVKEQLKNASEAQADQMLAVKKARTIEERWKILKEAQNGPPK
jgi:hypothetical protein